MGEFGRPHLAHNQEIVGSNPAPAIVDISATTETRGQPRVICRRLRGGGDGGHRVELGPTITALFIRASSTGVDARLICERSRFNSSCADPEMWLAGGWRQSYKLRRTVPSRFDSSVSDAQVYLNW